MSDQIPATLPLSILAEAGRLDAVPEGAPVAYENGPGWIGWEPDLARSDGSVHDKYEIDPKTPMGRAAIACIIAGLCGAEPLGASVQFGRVKWGGQTVSLVDSQDDTLAIWTEWDAGLNSDLSPDLLRGAIGAHEDYAGTLVAVVMHLVKP